MISKWVFKAAFAELLEDDEGIRHNPYDDATGQPVGKGTTIQGRLTIGIGRNLEAKPLSEEAIYFLLNEDMDEALGVLDKLFPGIHEYWPISVRLGVASMAYQLGGDGLAGFKNTIAALRQNNFESAAEHALDSLWARQTPNRAKRVAALIRNDSLQERL